MISLGGFVMRHSMGNEVLRWSFGLIAVGLVLCCGTRVAVAAYADEVLADDPFGYFRLNESGIDAENLGSAADFDLEFGEYMDSVEQQVPGLIAGDNDRAIRGPL